MRTSILTAGLSLGLLLLAQPSHAADVGEEVEVNSGAITALSCAMAAKTKGTTDPISSCSMADTLTGFAVFDMAMKEIYVLAPNKVHSFELERAFGGGRIDLVGTVVTNRDGIAELNVTEYTINPRPKPGAFKGCL